MVVIKNLDRVLQNYYCSNVAGLLELYLGKFEDYRCRIFPECILILGKFSEVAVAIKLDSVKGDTYRLKVDSYSSDLQHRSRILTSKYIYKCVDDLEVELKGLSTKVARIRSRYGR